MDPSSLFPPWIRLAFPSMDPFHSFPFPPSIRSFPFPLPIRSFPIPSMDPSTDWTVMMIGHRGLRLRPSIRDRRFRKLFTVHLRSAGSVYKGASLVAWQSVQWLFIEHLAQLLRPFAICWHICYCWLLHSIKYEVTLSYMYSSIYFACKSISKILQG